MEPESRCRYCGRAVRETTHRRESYRVDGFTLYTGETEEVVVRRHETDEVGTLCRRLVRPVVLVTCVDCYADPACRRRHRSWDYPAD